MVAKLTQKFSCDRSSFFTLFQLSINSFNAFEIVEHSRESLSILKVISILTISVGFSGISGGLKKAKRPRINMTELSCINDMTRVSYVRNSCSS